ncbi:LexA repressor [Iodidimonas muriae]|uniref:LexA repressor n=1 Tax=Iodidimonas muriae TaxID=261467 RepID=A0ABQ2LG89_9PROT|nr:transcriptional repressor LexA [Iodidimonas muriae]GER06979.1 LexA repressor [Kordiimonadales bacterium JCM 17843]GGO13527.1 LexA repressor [Iodidimonas muriae]
MLTAKQHQLLLFIHSRLSADGVSPSFDEMKDALGLKSKSGIHRLITALEERGFIRRLPNKARALDIVRMPDGIGDAGNTQTSANVVPFSAPAKPEAQPSHGRDQSPASDQVDIPLHGRIAAGTPIEALEAVDSYITVPQSMFGTGDHFALTVDGDSMIESGIMDGDTVVIKGCESAQDGEIVVALVDDQEATLKTLRRAGRDVELIPSNASHKTQRLAAERVKIQGRLVGLLRRY